MREETPPPFMLWIAQIAIAFSDTWQGTTKGEGL